MGKIKRIKRVTVLTKRTQRIRPTAKNKNKAHLPLYNKLKVNNLTLARALSQEKQESQMLFSRNVELIAELQDLTHSCHKKDLVIHNVLKNAKDMMQMLVTMSGYLTNTITVCKDVVSNSASSHQRTSSSTPGRRDSTKRMSTKSPAKGVVKPMVSGQTITKPTINLSRVNMQRLQNVNLSIIEEASSTPERGSTDNRRSRPLPERLPVPVINNTENEEHSIVSRRTSRYSGSRLSTGRRYSKRNSGRLSGRLSKRSTEYLELVKSPRVTLQDVSRYLPNNQTVNVHLLPESTDSANQSANLNDSNLSNSPSSAELLSNDVIPETQESCHSSESDSEPSTHLMPRKQRLIESDLIDPLEGPSWLHTDSVYEDQENRPPSDNSLNNSQNGETSPLSSFSCERRSRGKSLFRVPDLPKAFGKSNPARESMNASLNSPTPLGTVMDNTVYPSHDDDDDDDDDDDEEDDDEEEENKRRVNRFVTQRRGNSSRAPSNHITENAMLMDDEDEDDETLMLNMRRQVKPQPIAVEQPERLQFDVNELLQLTPLKPLLNMNGKTNNGPSALGNQADPDEATATIQVTQRLARQLPENTENFARMSVPKLANNFSESTPIVTVRSQEQNNQDRRLSDLANQRMSTRIDLPRITDVMNTSQENHHETQMILTPDHSKQMQKRKKFTAKKSHNVDLANQENIDQESTHTEKNTRQRKKKIKVKEENTNKDKESKDPSRAKVVLQKLNDSCHSNAQLKESGRKNSEESLSSIRSSLISRGDHSSDSECSMGSLSSKPLSTRPRRQKAPKNLQEPTLNKKLRRG